jgi:pectinesterase
MHRLAWRFSRDFGVLCFLASASGCGGDWGAPLAGRVMPSADPGASSARPAPTDPASEAGAAGPSSEPANALASQPRGEADLNAAPPPGGTDPSAPTAASAPETTDTTPASPAGAEATPAPAENDPLAPPVLLGTEERPQLDAATAARFEVLEYLARAGDLVTGLLRDDWDPTAGLGEVASFTADYRVAAQGGTHTSVQAAISAAVAAGGSERRYISVAPGTYREVVCVPSGAPPITLYGTDTDASRTTIVSDNYAGKAKSAGTAANPCNTNSAATTYGTAGSATFTVNASDFEAKNLSLVNQANEADATSNPQAVALLAQGDRAAFENVRLLGNQDTLFVKSPDASTVTRAYFKDSFIEGDTDFICGRGTFVLDGCEIHSLSSRTTSGVILAPSTDDRNPYGILVTHGTFTADSGADDASIHLGRAWDESQSNLTTYTANVATGIYPNGQAVVRDSTLGAHIVSDAPWRPAATTSRPYASVAGALPANRLYEYTNLGPGSAPQP